MVENEQQFEQRPSGSTRALARPTSGTRPEGIMNASVADGVAGGPRRKGPKTPSGMTVVPARFTPWGI